MLYASYNIILTKCFNSVKPFTSAYDYKITKTTTTFVSQKDHMSATVRIMDSTGSTGKIGKGNQKISVSPP